ncbi:MAG: hypothetical protein JNL93_14060 [Pelomonas sp.]|nr:hypothetical protein [Roseateles sp.]
MPNLANTLKQEIARIARKELRGELAGLRKAVTAHRTDLARMKRENVALEQEVRRLRREVSRLQPSPTEPASQPDSRFRYSAERLSATRAKLDLSAADFGLLVGASGLSIYKWERGTKPREKFMPALAAAMRMGKKEASAQLLKLKQSA